MVSLNLEVVIMFKLSVIVLLLAILGAVLAGEYVRSGLNKIDHGYGDCMVSADINQNGMLDSNELDWIVQHCN
jgi:hypothetical protein